MTSAIPAWIIAIPEMTASIPEMQTRLTVTAVTVSGIPAISAEMRVTLRASVGSMQQPKRTSSIRALSIPALMTASFITMLPSSAVHVAQRASEGADGGPTGRYDNNVFHIHSS